VRAILSRATEQVRRLARGLHLTIVDDLGLERALHGLIADTGAATRVQIELEREPPDPNLSDLPDLPGPVARLAYRTVQEGLANALRHADATSIRVRVAREANALTIQVVDDGRGFAPPIQGEVHGEGLGLWSLARRAEAAGGRFEVDTVPGNGTRITMRLPLR
jgi:signal transduction histidine kinase